STAQRFSCLSGYNDVGGAFVLPLKPGRYQIFAESLPKPEDLPGFPRFYDLTGAKVGPRIRRADFSWHRISPGLGTERQAVKIFVNGSVRADIDVAMERH